MKERIVSSIGSAPWEHAALENGEKISMQMLCRDPESGLFIEHMIYHPGTVTRKHRHNCRHGIYVLSGILYTDQGNYGPGTMVWFPDGVVMEHGATEELPCEVLFIADRPFDIEYLD